MKTAKILFLMVILGIFFTIDIFANEAIFNRVKSLENVTSIENWLSQDGDTWHRVGYCTGLRSKIAYPLRLILRQIQYETTQIIDKDPAYKSGSDKRTYIQDMGGCPLSNDANRAAGIYQHDAGGNFHRKNAVTDFLYYTTQDSNYTQLSYNREGEKYIRLYTDHGELQNFDWLRQVLFIRRLNTVFPETQMWFGTKLDEMIREKLINYPYPMRPLLKKFGLDALTRNDIGRLLKNAYPSDSYNHDKHIHVSFGRNEMSDNSVSDIVVDSDVFLTDDWYFNKSTIDSYNVKNAKDTYMSGNHDIFFPIANGAGAFHKYPLKCNGNYEIDTRRNLWKLDCDSGFEKMDNCPQGISDKVACPYVSDAPISDVKTCYGKICKGVNGEYESIQNQAGQRTVLYSDLWATKKYCCQGEYLIDVRGSNWDWKNGCSTGWVEADVTNVTTTWDDYKLTFADCNYGTSEDRPKIVEFTADGKDDLSVIVGKKITYKWEIKKALSVSSYYMVDEANSCGHKKGIKYSWKVKTDKGTREGAAGNCQVGSTYLLFLIAENKSGKVISKPLKILVKKEQTTNPSLEYFTVNGVTNLTAKPYDKVEYRWSIKNAKEVRSFYELDKDNACGHKRGRKYPWKTKTLKGNRTGTLATCMLGSTYSIFIEARNSGDWRAFSPIKLRIGY